MTISDNTRWPDEDGDDYYYLGETEEEEWEQWVHTTPFITLSTTTLYDQDDDKPALPEGEAKNGSLVVALALAKVREDLDDKLTPSQRATMDEAIRRLDPEGNVRSVLEEIDRGWEDE